MPMDFSNITNPRLWRLMLQVDPENIRFAVSSTVEDASLAQASVCLDASQAFGKALEEAIYSIPGLLSDFGSVDILVRTSAYTLVPPEVNAETATVCAEYAKIADDDTDDILLQESAGGCTIVWACSEAIINFLRRTFPTARIKPHIAPLLSYFGRQASTGNCGKIYMHLCEQPREADIMAYGNDGKLLGAFTKPFEQDADICYAAIATAKTFGMNVGSHDEIQLCGDSCRRGTLMPVLRRFAPRTVPLIFPSAAMRAGIEAFKAPFPLILLPLCE
ncbi:MAG: DUF3822 family protein [Muribaculaceae bacterium]|nr:DUF3822 family protein [Muribaculaceae bacterium]